MTLRHAPGVANPKLRDAETIVPDRLTVLRFLHADLPPSMIPLPNLFRHRRCDNRLFFYHSA